ncbi:MAG: hypothetical protein NC434_14915 [Ruminococcus sp.]|nr:hypothetical protein [Ruminococcus sp.]MCM1156484.1 hypothetical protein [Roseburia sp.]
MDLSGTTRQRTIDSFAAHDLKGSKRSTGVLSDTVIRCIADNDKISLNEVKKLRKVRKY